MPVDFRFPTEPMYKMTKDEREKLDYLIFERDALNKRLEQNLINQKYELETEEIFKEKYLGKYHYVNIGAAFTSLAIVIVTSIDLLHQITDGATNNVNILTVLAWILSALIFLFFGVIWIVEWVEEHDNK